MVSGVVCNQRMENIKTFIAHNRNGTGLVFNNKSRSGIMKVGDLIRVPPCTNAKGNPPYHPCGCIFCDKNSTRVGIVISSDSRAYINPGHLEVKFDIGIWSLTPDEVEIISESP